MGQLSTIMPEATETPLDEDPSLGERFAAGDERAFDAVVQHYGEPVSRLARRLLGWTEMLAEGGCGDA